MKSFELSNKVSGDGNRHFKMILHTIYPDDCINVGTEAGEEYNKNGITFIREYCEKALPTINGAWLRTEFVDEDRTEILGHGQTGIHEDGYPIFENASTIGQFTNGYIEDIETDDGTITVVIGEGEIDAQCYNNFVMKLDEDISNGNYPSGSVEIMRLPQNDGIVYLYGYKEKGRIPVEFKYSGYALLGVAPADDNAKLVELNEEETPMNENEVKQLIQSAVAETLSAQENIDNVKAECEQAIADAKAECEEKVNKAIAEKNEIEASVSQLQEALDAVNEEMNEWHRKYDELWEQHKVIEKALAEAQAKERLDSLDKAIETFSEDEIAYAQEEIDKFKENPIESEINSVVNKIYEGIGINAKKASDEAKVNETNSEHEEAKIEDIFGAIEFVDTKKDEDDNIF